MYHVDWSCRNNLFNWLTTMATKQEAGIIRLDEAADGDCVVVITKADEDRFSLTCRQAIEACEAHTSEKLWFAELESMFKDVFEWAQERSKLVRACFAAPRAGQVVIFIVPNSARFDQQLAEDIADLELRLSRDYRQITLELLQVPEGALNTFVGKKWAKPLYGTIDSETGD